MSVALKSYIEVVIRFFVTAVEAALLDFCAQDVVIPIVENNNISDKTEIYLDMAFVFEAKLMKVEEVVSRFTLK